MSDFQGQITDIKWEMAVYLWFIELNFIYTMVHRVWIKVKNCKNEVVRSTVLIACMCALET
jgi:hypothetical protein